MGGEFPESVAGGRPPYRYVDGEADFKFVCDAANLDSDSYAKREYLQSEGLFALIEMFTDGELRILTGEDQILSNKARKCGGQERYGEFFEKIHALRTEAVAEGGVKADEVNRLARFCGNVLADFVEKGTVTLPSSDIVRPNVSPFDGSLSLTFNDYVWQAPRRPAVVLEYGPGVAGTKFLDAQLAGLGRNQFSFQYVAVSDGPFVNQFLLNYLGNNAGKQYGPEVRSLATSGTLFVGREDGMLQATAALLATPQPSGSHEICDLILMTAVHDAQPEELEFTMKHSVRLLRQGGKLLLSAPLTRPKATMTPFPELLDWAMDVGYIVEWQRTAQTGDVTLGTNTHSGFAVLLKP